MGKYDFEHRLETPAYVYNTAVLTQTCQRWHALCHELEIEQYYPLKTNSFQGILQTIARYVVGFSASSPYEAHVANDLGGHQNTHYTSPGLRDSDLDELITRCTGISFNSMSLWLRMRERVVGKISCGLRVNPQMSVVSDTRYDPCCYGSRLGVPMDLLCQQYKNDPTLFTGIDHVQIHTNADSENWSSLYRTVEHLTQHIDGLLRQCTMLNLGGGYILPEQGCPDGLRDSVELLKRKYGVSVVIEPGAGVVRDAVSLFARVTDIIQSDDRKIAILDTSVNHLPEVFEYQYSPDVAGDSETGQFVYTLAGSTCLAGDVFGAYAFDEPLEIGSLVEFIEVGAYAHVKNHMFNGVPTPNLYELTAFGQCFLRWRCGYDDFRQKTFIRSEHP